MNSIISFTLKDFGMFILWALLVLMIVYIIRVLLNALMIVKRVRIILDENEETVTKFSMKHQILPTASAVFLMK